MEPKEKKAFEPSGLVPRSIVRTFERFRQQLLPGSETAAIREYRISRYQVLVSARCLFTLLIIPIATNWLVSSWLLSPLVEHFWNTQQNEIFVNSYQEERAFAELESFSEKLFFESLLNTTNTINVANPRTSSASPYFALSTNNTDPIGTPSEFILVEESVMFDSLANYYNPLTLPFASLGISTASPVGIVNKANFRRGFEVRKSTEVKDINEMQAFTDIFDVVPSLTSKMSFISAEQEGKLRKPSVLSEAALVQKRSSSTKAFGLHVQPAADSSINKVNESVKNKPIDFVNKPLVFFHAQLLTPKEYKPSLVFSSASQLPYDPFSLRGNRWGVGYTSNVKNKEGLSLQYLPSKEKDNCYKSSICTASSEGLANSLGHKRYPLASQGKQNYNQELNILTESIGITSNSLSANQRWSLAKPATVLSSASSYPLPPSGLGVQTMTYDNSLKVKEKVQNKILELAIYYNQQTIISITNIIGDIVSLVTLGCLFIWMKPEITILKSFLIEAIYSLSDTTKSFLLILLTDLLVGFHSPRGWETALELLLKHFGLPENQDFVFLFVATFPVLLDTVFKYWIFRHLNKISPSTVATYHSMIE